MKLKRLFSPFMLVAFAMAAVMSSCTNKAETIEDKLKKYVSDDVDIVVALDLKRTLEAAEISSNEDGSLELPGYLNSFVKDALSSSERKNLNKFLDFKGFDWTNTVMGIKVEGKEADKMEALLVFSVKDDDEFADAIENETDLSKDEEDGYIVLSDKEGCVLVKGKVGFMAFNQKGVCKSGSAIEMVEAWEDAADDKEIAQWKIDKLKEEKVAKVLMSMKAPMNIAKNDLSDREYDQLKSLGLDKLSDAYLYADFDLNGPTASLGFKVLADEGKEFKVPGLNLGTIDASLLDYANSNDIAAAAIATGDLNELVDKFVNMGLISGSDVSNARQFTQLASGATLMVAGGPANGLSSFMNSDYLGNWHIVAAVRFSSQSNADTFLSLMQSLIGSEINSDGAGNMSMSVPTAVGSRYNYDTGEFEEYPLAYKTVYIKHDGKDVVVSNAPISRSGSCSIDRNIFSGKTMAFAIDMPKSNSVMAQLGMPFGAKAVLNGTSSTADLSVSITGASGKLIPTLFKFVYENMDNFGGGYAESESYATQDTTAYAYEEPAPEAPAEAAPAAYDYDYVK